MISDVKIISLDQLITSPAVWPGTELQVQPGDLTTFAPSGNRVYGYEAQGHHPIESDPAMEPSGGRVFFGNDVVREDFQAFLRMMEIPSTRKDYAAFLQKSSQPVTERYFTQLRMVSKFALKFMFKAINDHEYGQFKDQELSVEEALWAFMDREREKYGTRFGNPKIEGLFGGDGNLAREELSFGFMLENEYHQVYRIWSRAWLVTK